MQKSCHLQKETFTVQFKNHVMSKKEVKFMDITLYVLVPKYMKPPNISTVYLFLFMPLITFVH
jgi:hypothetical protein